MKNKTPTSNLLVIVAFLAASILIVIEMISIVFTEGLDFSLIIVGIFFTIVSIVCLMIILKQIYLRKNWDEKNNKQEFEKKVDANVWNDNQRLLYYPSDRSIDNPKLDEKLGIDKEYILKQDKYGNQTIIRIVKNPIPWIISSIVIVGITIGCVVGIVNNNWKHIVDMLPQLFILGLLMYGDVFCVSETIKKIRSNTNKKNRKKKSKTFSIFYKITIIFFILLVLYFIYSLLTVSINETVLICLFVLYMISGLIAFIIQTILLVSVKYSARKNK